MLVCVVIVRVLNDALAYFEGQIQASECGVSLFEIFDDAQGVKIVIERESVLTHSRVEGLLSRVAERRMADVVDESERFGKIYVEIQSSGYRARDLRDFQRMRQAIAKMIGITASKNLSLGFQAAKGARVNHPVAVTLKIIAVSMRRLGVSPSEGVLHRIPSEHGRSVAEEALSSQHLAKKRPRQR